MCTARCTCTLLRAFPVNAFLNASLRVSKAVFLLVFYWLRYCTGLDRRRCTSAVSQWMLFRIGKYAWRTSRSTGRLPRQVIIMTEIVNRLLHFCIQILNTSKLVLFSFVWSVYCLKYLFGLAIVARLWFYYSNQSFWLLFHLLYLQPQKYNNTTNITVCSRSQLYRYVKFPLIAYVSL